MANLENQSCQVRVQNLPKTVQLKFLDETNAQEAMEKPEEHRVAPSLPQKNQEGILTLQLKPYALARIDYQGREA
jgi:hypothetical protein